MIGKTISHYKILDKLGEGGMGVVYRAHDTKLDRFVALKFLPTHLTQYNVDKQRFIREAKAAAALNHPNICTIYSVEEHDGQQFISMEYIDGVTLRGKIEIPSLSPLTKGGLQGGFSVEQAINFSLQIAEALAEAHEKDIVHRDIKPENIMVDSKNRIKVMDFGLAKEKTQIDKQLTDNMDSYTLYLKGKYHWNKFTYEDVRKSIDYYKQAIELDPHYALGYSGLANAYSVLGLDFDHPRQTFEKARKAAQKALETDGSLPEAHASIAAVWFFFDREYVKAENAFRQAIMLNQSYAEAHELYAYFLSAMGRHDEAYKEIQYAINLDPLSLIINKDLGSYYFWARQYEKAIEQFHKTIEMEPRFFITYGELGWAYSGLGMHRDALDAFSKAVELSGGARSFDIAGIGYMYAQLGEHEKAQKILSDLLSKSTQRFIGPEDIALVYAALGNHEMAFTYMEKALQEHGFYMCFIMVDHRFDILRNDPRFNEIVKKMGL